MSPSLGFRLALKADAQRRSGRWAAINLLAESPIHTNSPSPRFGVVLIFVEFDCPLGAMVSIADGVCAAMLFVDFGRKPLAFSRAVSSITVGIFFEKKVRAEWNFR